MQLGTRQGSDKCLPRYCRRAVEHLGGGWSPAAIVGAENDIGIEKRNKALELTATGCAEEGVDHLPLPSKIRIWSRQLRPLDSAPRPARELSCCLGRSPDHRSDLGEGHLEHVVEHEREPLGRREGIEHDQEREADRVGQHRFLFGLAHSLDADIGIGEVAIERFLAPGIARPQDVQTDASNDGGQPAAKVFNLASPGPADPEPGVLNSVVRLRQGAEHPVGHGS